MPLTRRGARKKAVLEKCPANQTYILYSNDTCFAQASRGFLIWLKESCQDYYGCVNMTRSKPSPSSLCSFVFENISAKNKEGTVFMLRFFIVSQSHRAKDWHLNTDNSAQYFPYAPGLGSRERTFCPMYHMLEITSKRNSVQVWVWE